MLSLEGILHYQVQIKPFLLLMVHPLIMKLEIVETLKLEEVVLTLEMLQWISTQQISLLFLSLKELQLLPFMDLEELTELY